MQCTARKAGLQGGEKLATANWWNRAVAAARRFGADADAPWLSTLVQMNLALA